MSRDVNTFRVGLFVVVSIALLVAAVVIWGMVRYMQETRVYVTYFNESVQGLEKNAEVKFRGVTVGRVGSIGLAPDGTLVEVRMNIDSDFAVKDSYVVRVMSAGITGMKYLGIQPLDGHAPPEKKLTFTPACPVIRSYPSATVDRVIDLMETRLSEMDMQGISVGLTNALTRINQILAHRQWAPVISNVQATSLAVRHISDEVDAYVASGEAREFVENAAELTERLNRIFFLVEGRMDEILQTLDITLNNLRAFSEELRTRPAQTLFSEPQEQQ